jgi:TPR repeat protein
MAGDMILLPVPRYWRLISTLVMIVALPLEGCSSSSYMGISLRPSGADPALQALAQRAQLGDKQAQLELGMQYELGVNVPQNCLLATELYRLAARESSETTWVYLHGVGKGALGRVIPVRSGRKIEGLGMAKDRFEAVKRLCK